MSAASTVHTPKTIAAAAVVVIVVNSQRLCELDSDGQVQYHESR
jgi:hypothetical protein